MTMDMKVLLNKLVDGNNLTQKEASFLLEGIITGELNPIQAAAVLVSLRAKGETEQEILGFIKTMQKHMVKIKASGAIDIVGTGGDGLGTFNISTASSFVVAGAGIPVAKHGNRAVSGKCGSADVLERLGVNINLAPKQAEKVFTKTGMVFLFAPIYHPAMKQVAQIRKQLGIRTIFNLLGPFLNPARVKRVLIGVPNIEIAKKLARVAAKLNFTLLYLVTAEDGLDEISINTDTHLFEIQGLKIRQKIISASQGVPLEANLLGEDAGVNARILTDVLSGKIGPQRDIVVLNSAYALLASGCVKSVKAGIKMAEKSIDSGAAKKVLENLIQETQKYA